MNFHMICVVVDSHIVYSRYIFVLILLYYVKYDYRVDCCYLIVNIDDRTIFKFTMDLIYFYCKTKSLHNYLHC